MFLTKAATARKIKILVLKLQLSELPRNIFQFSNINTETVIPCYQQITFS